MSYYGNVLTILKKYFIDFKKFKKIFYSFKIIIVKNSNLINLIKIIHNFIHLFKYIKIITQKL